MIITRLEVRTAQGALLNLPFDTVTGGIFVKSIEGLDPVKATLVSTSFAQIDGAQYHSSRREARNLKIQLGLAPDEINETIRELRNRMYTYFMPKTEISLRFFIITGESVLDNYYVDIKARIESFDSPLFVQEPSIDLSLIAFDPDFVDPVPVIFSGNSTSTLAEETLTYVGTVETGFKLTLMPTRAMSAFTIYQRPADGTLRMMDFSSDLEPGDVLTIITTVGEKSVTRSRAGYDTSLLYALSPQSNWLELQPGNNAIRVYETGDAIPYTIEYNTRYGGL